MAIKPMSVLILEDDIEECKKLIECINSRNDFELIAFTDSDVEALNLVKLKKPEGIILDIELNNSTTGNINSFDFLKTVRKLDLGYNPIIIVTTHSKSTTTHNLAHKYGADTILYKHHPSYSASVVLNTLLAYRTSTNTSNVANFNLLTQDYKKLVSEYIANELDLLGVTQKLKGRKYLYDAILYIIDNMDKPEPPNVFKFLMKLHTKSDKTINGVMQTAIRHAWKVSSTDDLEKFYTARINPETGIPTPTEFIYYYADKAKRNL